MKGYFTGFVQSPEFLIGRLNWFQFRKLGIYLLSARDQEKQVQNKSFGTALFLCQA